MSENIIFCYRGCKEKWYAGSGPLSSRCLSLRYDSHRLYNEIQAPIDDRGVQDGESRASDHLSKSELHGSAPGAGAELT